MTLSEEAEKYRSDFSKAAALASQKIQTGQFKNDLELIKTINKTLDDLKAVRTKHVQHE